MSPCHEVTDLGNQAIGERKRKCDAERPRRCGKADSRLEVDTDRARSTSDRLTVFDVSGQGVSNLVTRVSLHLSGVEWFTTQLLE